MTPTTEDELAEAIKSAKGPLRITGGGTRDIGNPVVGEALSTSAMSGISLYEPGALTLVAKAGTPLREIEAALDAENQRLAFEPMDHRTLLGTTGEPTIGGVVSANVSGSRRIAVGACRDHALGVRFVDSAGTITKNGGRVMKNVTGYDLVKLLTGAYGTLGVLSEVSLKVLPKPETSATLILHGLTVADSVAAMSKALGTPYEVTGAAMSQGNTCIRIEGFDASVRYRMGKLKDALASFGDMTQADGADSEALWRDITNVTQFKDSTTVSRISVKPSAAAGLVQDHLEGAKIALDWGGGLIWTDLDQTADSGGTHSDIQTALCEIGGHATLVKASMDMRASVSVFQPENPTVTALSEGLRAKFDPRGILNTGLMG